MANKISQFVLLFAVSYGSCLFAVEQPGTVLSIYYLKTKSPGGYNAIVEEVLYADQISHRANFALAIVHKNHIVKKAALMDSQIFRGFFTVNWEFHSEAAIKDGKHVTSLGEPLPFTGRLINMKDHFWSNKPSATMIITDSGEIIVEGKVSGEELHRRHLVRAEDFLDPDTTEADVYKIVGAKLSLDRKGLERADVLVIKKGEPLKSQITGIASGPRIGGDAAGHNMKVIIGQLKDRRILPVDTLAGTGSRTHVYVSDSPYNIENTKIELDLDLSEGRILLKEKNQSARLVRINKPKFSTHISAETVAAAALNRWADAYPHVYEKLNPQLTGDQVGTCEASVFN